MNILIVEDDLLIAEMLKDMLLEIGYKVPFIASDYESAVAFLDEADAIELVILDINLMSSKSGLELAATINKDYLLPFIFLTSYSNKGMIDQALQLKPAAYLIKPFNSVELYTTIEIFRRKVHSALEKTIIIKDGTINVKLKLSNIMYVKSDNIYIEIKTNEKSFLIRQSLEKFLEQLNDSRFIRIHRSFVVNLNAINAISGMQLMIGNEILPISRNIKEDLLVKFNADNKS